MSLKCAYHPERDASEKCEKCGKVICLECKMVYHETHRGGTGERSYAYSVRHEYCPVCFYDRKIKTYGPQAKITATIFTIIVLIMIFVIFNMMGDYFPLFFLLVIIPLDIYAFVYGPRKLKEFRYKKAEFLNSLTLGQPVKGERLKESFCPECGNKLELNTSVCSYCGSVIEDSMNNGEKFGARKEGVQNNPHSLEIIQEEKILKMGPVDKKKVVVIIISIIFIIIGIALIIPEAYNMLTSGISDDLDSRGVSSNAYNKIMMTILVLFVSGFVFIGIGIFILVYFYMRNK